MFKALLRWDWAGDRGTGAGRHPGKSCHSLRAASSEITNQIGWWLITQITKSGIIKQNLRNFYGGWTGECRLDSLPLKYCSVLYQTWHVEWCEYLINMRFYFETICQVFAEFHQFFRNHEMILVNLINLISFTSEFRQNTIKSLLLFTTIEFLVFSALKHVYRRSDFDEQLYFS